MSKILEYVFIGLLPEVIKFLSQKESFERKQIQQTLGKQRTNSYCIVVMVKCSVPKMLEDRNN